MNPVYSSFRDCSGYVYKDGGKLKRSVNHIYESNYNQFIQSGLSSELISLGYLIPFTESNCTLPGSWKTLDLEVIPFFSHPCEWSFTQLRDAAILTLNVQLLSLKKSMILKDASAYNVTFHNGRPIFVDHLSFEIIEDGGVWKGYKQFCSHFLSPLLLMSMLDIRTGQFLRNGVDGIPLDLTANLLPLRSYFNIGTLLHIHLHAWAQKKYSNRKSYIERANSRTISTQSLCNLTESLLNLVYGLTPRNTRTVWNNYYSECTYTNYSSSNKLEILCGMVDFTSSRSVLDLGANNGHYSRAVAKNVDLVISTDFDPSAVDSNYKINCMEKITNVIPLVIDVTNPTSGFGWSGKERASFNERASFDCVLALALIHHLAISSAIPFNKIAECMASYGNNLIIEWVPPNDSQVERIAAMNPSILQGYTFESFITAFTCFFDHIKFESVSGTNRTIHLFKTKQS